MAIYQEAIKIRGKRGKIIEISGKRAVRVEKDLIFLFQIKL